MNNLLTTQLVSFETLDSLDNMMVLGNLANREFDTRFGQAGAKIGEKFSQRKPQRYIVQEGEDIGDIQGLDDDFVDVEIKYQDHIPITFSQRERALSIDDYKRRYIKPQSIALTNKVDKRGFYLYRNVTNSSGTPGSALASSAVALDAGVRMANESVPMDDEAAMITNPRGMATIVAAEQTLFHASDEIRSQYLRGQMGQAHGFTWYRSQNPVTHTCGAYAGAGRVNGAGQTGSSLVTDNWTGSITKLLRWGDYFTIGTGATACNMVNPVTYEDIGELRQFTVTADVDSSAGAATIPISPPIVTSGPKQTVVASPAHQAALTVNNGAAANTRSTVGLALHRDAFALTIVDLPKPMGNKECETVRSTKYRMAFQMVADFDLKTYKNIVRVDLLYAWTLMREQFASRVYCT